MRRLADVVNGRDNNFHLIRMIAASMVLVSHSVALATGQPELEPWRAWLGITPGSVAVDIFFVVSGLLVTQSLDRRSDAWSFARARMLRIWPGLVVALVLTVFGLGLWFTELAGRDYLAHRDTWRHLVKNLLLVTGIDYRLPGVFTHNPWPAAVNGSLWTLPSEVRAYGVLLGVWGLALWGLRGRWPWRWLVLVLLAGLVLRHAQQLAQLPLEKSDARLFTMFFAGSTAYLFRDRIRLPAWGLPLTAGLLLASTALPGLFAWVYSLTLPGLVLAAAYAPAGGLRHYNRLGDYSYGVYIYAYPVQQAVAALWPGCTATFMTAVAGAFTLVLAVLSWHWVENPALQWGARRWRRPQAG